jgi:energy-coupling factor transport system substrate-specific component
MRKYRSNLHYIATIGVLVALIEACKLAMAHIPNVELTSFWLIIFTVFFGRKAMIAVPIFTLLEGAIYGFGLWWVMYLYTWPALVLVAYMMRKSTSALPFALLSGIFGLSFGFLCAIPYVFVGSPTPGLAYAFGYWVAGIPFDLTHGVANFVLMLVLYRPVTSVMEKVARPL